MPTDTNCTDQNFDQCTFREFERYGYIAHPPLGKQFFTTRKQHYWTPPVPAITEKDARDQFMLEILSGKIILLDWL